MLDIDFARGRFPALTDDWALFDNAGGSVPLGGVIERVTNYMSRTMVQLGATYRHSAEAGELVAAGKAAAARLVNAAEPAEIVIGPSSTMNVKVLARALRPLLREGDEVVVTNLDHETNVGAWHQLADERIEVREWRFDPESLELRIEDLDELLSDRTRLVCFTHCSNIVGTLHDAAAIIRRVHEAGALSCVDGVAFAPHRRVDVRELGADFYFLSLYKTYGPHLGMLYVRSDLLERVASQNHFFIGEDEGPYRLEPGGPNHELTASLPAIVEYLDELGGDGGLDAAFEAMAEHEEAIVAPLLEYLRSRSDVRILGHPEADRRKRAPTVSFVVEGRRSSEIPPILDEERIAIRWGHFYAHRAIDALGLLERDGVVRVSMVHYNTEEEVTRLIEALDRAL
ncbi:MAG: cysteine desulfurase-like protein [Planctomycetota bacterium]|jgi:cysteine desulfurase family protein (TIGR01976 family)